MAKGSYKEPIVAGYRYPMHIFKSFTDEQHLQLNTARNAAEAKGEGGHSRRAIAAAKKRKAVEFTEDEEHNEDEDKTASGHRFGSSKHTKHKKD